MIVTFMAALALGCSPHEQPEQDDPAIPTPEPLPAGDYEPPPPRPQRRARPEPERIAAPIEISRPLLAGPPVGPAAYFASKTDVVRLDATGWTRIWYGPVDELLAGLDGHVYIRDRAGIHRIADDALWTYLADDDGRLNDLRGVAIGRESEIWLLEPDSAASNERERKKLPPIPSRIDADGTTMIWDDRERTGLESFAGMTVDGDGRAWFLLTPQLGILHKTEDRWWGRVQGWELGREPMQFVDWRGDPRGGLILLTNTELLRVSTSGATERATIPDDEPRQLALNHRRRQALVLAGCHLYRFELDALTRPPTDLGFDDEAECIEELAAFDDRGRAWELFEGTGLRVTDEAGTSISIELARLGPWDVRALVVVGAGPPLPAAIDGKITPEPLPTPDRGVEQDP